MPRWTSAAAASSVTAERRELVCLMFGDQRFDDLFKIAPEHLFKFVQGQVDAVIGDPSLWEVVGADTLRAVATADEVTPVLGFLSFLLANLGQFMV